MPRFFAAASLMMCAGAAGQTGPAANTLSLAEEREGWILLFDGKSMTGWDDPRLKSPVGDAWTIEDGCLKAIAHPRISEDLFTTTTFRDFELAFDWRISSSGNSGVKYRIQDHRFVVPPDRSLPRERFEQQVDRSFTQPVRQRPEKGQDYVIGFEYQMTDDVRNGDARSSSKHTTAALYDMVAPQGAVVRAVGEFNRSRILVEGSRVEHWLNGVKVVEAWLDSPEVLQGIKSRWGIAPHVFELLATQPRKDCPISLQNHGDEVWFRNIKIRRLNSK